MASEIRVNKIQNRSGLTTTTFTDTGVTISGILTVSENLNVGGVLTYEDVTNVDAIGIVTARAGINLVGNDLNVGSNIKIGNASGIVTATTFSGSGANLTNLPAGNLTGTLPAISGANLTSLPAQATIANNADNRVITGGSGVNLNGEANLTFDGTNLDLGDTKKIRIGDSQDLELFHNGANSGIINSQGALYITNDATNSSDVHIRGKSSIKLHCPADGDVRILINSSGDFGFNDTSPTAHASGNNTVLSIKGKGSSYSGKIDFKDSSGNLDSYINSDNSVLQFYADPNSQNGNTSMLFHVHGGERLRIGRHGQIGIAGANYGAARQVIVSNGSGSAVSWSSNPFLLDMDGLGDIDYDAVFLRYRETAAITGNGLVHLGLCKSTTNCGPGRIGVPVGFIPGTAYNAHFRVDKVGITPWPDGSGHRYEFYAIISDYVSTGKLGIFYLTNSTN